MTMMTITQDEIEAALGTVPSLRLKVLDLLAQHPPRGGDWFPADVSSEALAEAAVELMAYSADCAAYRSRIEELGPVPLLARTPETEGYGL